MCATPSEPADGLGGELGDSQQREGAADCHAERCDADGILIIDPSGNVEPLSRSSGKGWRIPQGGKTFPLNQRFARRWQIPQRMLERLSKDHELRHALERDDLAVYFQPEAEVQTSSVVGVEALLRWHHPQRGLVLPDEFIPLAERTGFIVRLGEWVMRTAGSLNADRLSAGLPPLRIAVNLSPRQFQQPNLSEMIAEVLAETKLPPQLLELEITEGTAMQNAAFALGVLRDLWDMGVHLVLDDFGTGYSSLNYLKDFPIHALKIDRSFVQGITTQPNDAAIVSAIIGIGHSLNLEVVAEGVETAAQLAFLQERQCDRFQGFLLAKASPYGTFLSKQAA